MKKNAYERVTAVVKSWTLGTTSFKRNLEFGSMPAYKSIKRYGKVGGMLGIKTPFFRSIDGRVGNSCIIDGKNVLNFAWCDYLGLNQHPELAGGS